MFLAPAWFAQANMLGGDESPGEGLSTGNSTTIGALAADGGIPPGDGIWAGMRGTLGGHAVVWWFAVVAFIVILKYAWEGSGEKEDYKNIRVGVYSWVVITVNAVLGIVFLKWLAAKYKIPGFTELMATA